jgi:hypothetical protein
MQGPKGEVKHKQEMCFNILLLLWGITAVCAVLNWHSTLVPICLEQLIRGLLHSCSSAAAQRSDRMLTECYSNTSMPCWAPRSAVCCCGDVWQCSSLLSATADATGRYCSSAVHQNIEITISNNLTKRRLLLCAFWALSRFYVLPRT